MTREEHLAKSKALAERLIDLVRKEETHALAMDGLMLAFMSVATSHPCCIEGAAHVCMHNAQILIDQARAQQQPASSHIH